VATPAHQEPTTLDEALVRLKRNPEHPVQANVGELEIELRVIGKTADTGQGGPYDSLLASAGTAEALGDDIARHKWAHLADVYAPKYVLPASSAHEFMAELEDDTEEPTPELRALLRGAGR
jgi:hypothetical protein